MIELRDVSKTYGNQKYNHKESNVALNHVNLIIPSRKKVGLIGESGAGKTTIAKLIMRGLSPTSGKILFDGSDIADFDNAKLKQYRKNVQMTFQDARGSLDPRMTIRANMAEPIRCHSDMPTHLVNSYIDHTLDSVGLDTFTSSKRPKELSEGQCQRVVLARAIALQPSLLILDEPTSSLDGLIKANIIQLLLKIYHEFGIDFLLISHDFVSIRVMCDEVYVIYDGRIIEFGSVAQIFENPKHPYSKELLASDTWSANFGEEQPTRISNKIREEILIRHQDSELLCTYYAKCPIRQAICLSLPPPAVKVIGSKYQQAACHFQNE
ncbi:MAG: ATP-binding cassette domain-containing protein [Methylococcales bacterium]|nr:ATP-binding cassette domain-containing protein [Methylococcales bacterium]